MESPTGEEAGACESRHGHSHAADRSAAPGPHAHTATQPSHAGAGAATMERQHVVGTHVSWILLPAIKYWAGISGKKRFFPGANVRNPGPRQPAIPIHPRHRVMSWRQVTTGQPLRPRTAMCAGLPASGEPPSTRISIL
jgi:hypothetical protein